MEDTLYGKPFSWWLSLRQNLQYIENGEKLMDRLARAEREVDVLQGKLAVYREAVARLGRSVEGI